MRPPAHEQNRDVSDLFPFFCGVIRAASHINHLRAGEPGGAGDTSEQTGGELGDGDGPQVSLTKQFVIYIGQLAKEERATIVCR